jgi:carbamoyltransferase
MKIIGFNLEKTVYGLPLDNGGACLFIDGKIKMLINEERLNRKQYSPGFKGSINYILDNCDIKIGDIDLFVASSCLEPQSSVENAQKQLKNAGFDIDKDKIRICGHHFSHALTAYYPSKFDEAIIMVIDGDGNTISNKMKSGTDSPEKFWLNENEHNSYYVGKNDHVEFLERDNIGIGENGFGGAYRYFTYFCGFHGYKFAGKLMGLSAYGCKRNKYKDLQLFELGENGYVRCLLPDSDRANSTKVVEGWLKEQGLNIKAQKPNEPITEEIEDIAFFVQRELDRALVHKVKYLIKKTGIKNLCIAGGVGLNAVSNRAILDNTEIKKIFIQPASGDSGQCLGNAYFGIVEMDKENLKRKPISVYQGKEYEDEDFEKALKNKSTSINFKKLSFEEITKIASQKIADNKVIAWFQDRSEMGPRALGNRSILANPANKDMKGIINARVKHREAFRPFAPSVLEEKAKDWFDINFLAPYMIINAPVKQPEKIPSVTHKDDSARLQTVNSKQNEKYYNLISEVDKITGIPVVLNTSFNDNEAIVESPEDAVNTFLRTNIDYLFMGNYFAEKKLAIQSEWSRIADEASEIQVTKNKVLNPIVIDLVNKYCKGKKLFDYSCGWGEFSNDMQKQGFGVTAFDEADEMIKKAKQNFQGPHFMYKSEFEGNYTEMQKTFDVVTSNLLLCILEKNIQKIVLKHMKNLVKDDGVIIISFCHPYYDFLPDSLVTKRFLPADAQYYKEFMFEKEIKENGVRFHDYHRPMEYYKSLLDEMGLEVIETRDSDTLNSKYDPDFLIFTLKKKHNA